MNIFINFLFEWNYYYFKGIFIWRNEVICAFLPHGKTLPPEHIREWISSRLDNPENQNRDVREVDAVTLDNSSQNFTFEITEKKIYQKL